MTSMTLFPGIKAREGYYDTSSSYIKPHPLKLGLIPMKVTDFN